MLHNHRDFNPAERGYSIVYHEGEPNRCPGCGQSQWIVGRSSAECAFCATALPLDLSRSLGAGLFHSTGRAPESHLAWAH